MSDLLNDKILHVCNSMVYGGGEEHVRTILKYLRKLGLNVCAAVPENSKLFFVLKKEGIDVHPYFIKGKFDIKALFSLRNIIRTYKITMIHTHNRQEDLMGGLVSMLTGVPAVTTIHDRINMNQQGEKVTNFQSAVYHFILRNCFSQLITVSKATYDDIIKYAKVNETKITHVVNGIDLDRITATKNTDQMKRELNIEPDKKIVGFVARIRGKSFGKKGIIHLIDASEIITKKFPQTIFVVSGEDTESADILKIICAEKKVLRNFRFIGYREDIIDVINCFDLLVCPSLFEGLPRVVMESMALGKPVVGSNVDGIPEVIQDGVTGYLVAPKDHLLLAEKILMLLENDNLRTEFGKKGKERIYNCFNASVSAKDTAEIYTRLINSRKRHLK